MRYIWSVVIILKIFYIIIVWGFLSNQLNKQWWNSWKWKKTRRRRKEKRRKRREKIDKREIWTRNERKGDKKWRKDLTIEIRNGWEMWERKRWKIFSWFCDQILSSIIISLNFHFILNSKKTNIRVYKFDGKWKIIITRTKW